MRRWVHSRNWILVIVLISVLSASGCGQESAKPKEVPKETKKQVTCVIPVAATPKTLNPDWQKDDGANNVLANVYSHLVTHDWGVAYSGYEPVYGDLAKSWDVSPDAKIYTFHLYPNVKWHDGKPLTSEDVKYTFDTIIAQKYPYVSYLTDVKEIRTPDPNTVVIELVGPNAAFVPMLAQGAGWYGQIVPKHLYQGTDWQTSKVQEHPTGTGPFKFVSWDKPGNLVTLEANKDYFRGPPAIDKLMFRFIADSNTIRAAFDAGEVQTVPYTNMVSYDKVAKMLQDPAQKDLVVQTDSTYNYNLIFNVKNPPFDKLKVRQAIAYAMDRETLNKQAFAGTWTPRKIFGHTCLGDFLNPNAVAPDFNKAMAEKLLDEAGYPRKADGKRFKVKFNVAAYDYVQSMAQMLVPQFQAIGIDVELLMGDQVSFNDRMSKSAFDVAIYYYRYDPDPDALRIAFGKGQPRNFTNWYNDEVDKLFVEARRTSDKSKRVEYYRKAQELIAKEMPIVPLEQENKFSLVAKGWTGFPVQKSGFNKSISWFGYYALKPPATK